jgi:hypothetical protein
VVPFAKESWSDEEGGGGRRIFGLENLLQKCRFGVLFLLFNGRGAEKLAGPFRDFLKKMEEDEEFIGGINKEDEFNLKKYFSVKELKICANANANPNKAIQRIATIQGSGYPKGIASKKGHFGN